MKPTDTSEKELERLIVRHLAGISEHPSVVANCAHEPDVVYAPGGYVLGRASDYNRDVALDVAQLLAFLQATQPKAADTLELAADGINFEGETDTELVAHLVNREIRGGAEPTAAVEATLKRLEGAFALAFLFEGRNDLMIGARRGSSE